MESRDYTGEFENFLQEKADQYKLYPSDRVWNAINGKLHPRKKWSYLFVAAIFIGLGIGGKVHDSIFLQGFEKGTDVRSYSNTEFADKVPVVPNGTATSLKKSSRVTVSQLATEKEKSPASPVSSGTSHLPLTLTERSIAEGSEEVHNAGLSDELSNEMARVIVADEVHQLTEGNVTAAEPLENEKAPAAPSLEKGSVVSPSAEKLYAEQQSPAIMEEGSTTGEESFVELEAEHHRINAFASVPTATSGLSAKDITATHLAAPAKAASIKILKPRHLNLGWQLYLSPTVSYRKLSGEGMKYFNGFIAASSPDVNHSVTHKPSIGFEIGTALTFSTGRNFRLKSGLQVNVNQYDVQAFYFTPEVAPMTRGGIGHSEINVISRYRNFDGFSKTWLRNKHIMMSVPLGAEMTVFGSDKVKFNIAGTLQPTFVLNNQAYMISTNMKNYAQEPSLYRKFNLAAGAEAYLSIKAGSYRWMIGPQFRYQIFSSHKDVYPITEHLFDYGFKIGITR
jgi:hypothetical protein